MMAIISFITPNHLLLISVSVGIMFLTFEFRGTHPSYGTLMLVLLDSCPSCCLSWSRAEFAFERKASKWTEKWIDSCLCQGVVLKMSCHTQHSGASWGEPGWLIWVDTGILIGWWVKSKDSQEKLLVGKLFPSSVKFQGTKQEGQGIKRTKSGSYFAETRSSWDVVPEFIFGVFRALPSTNRAYRETPCARTQGPWVEILLAKPHTEPVKWRATWEL